MKSVKQEGTVWIRVLKTPEDILVLSCHSVMLNIIEDYSHQRHECHVLRAAFHVRKFSESHALPEEVAGCQVLSVMLTAL